MSELLINLMGLELRLLARENLGVLIFRNKHCRVMYRDKLGHFNDGEEVGFLDGILLKMFPVIHEEIEQDKVCLLYYSKENKNYQVGICEYQNLCYCPEFIGESVNLMVALFQVEDEVSTKYKLCKNLGGVKNGI